MKDIQTFILNHWQQLNPMIKSLVIIPKSIEATKVASFLSRHISSMKGAKGLIEINESDGAIMSPGGPTPYSNVLIASWTSLEVFIAWAENHASEEDKNYMLENGASLLFYEVKD
jgi:hypothetical protein